MGHRIKVETQGSVGAKNMLTDDEIRAADAVVIAADTYVDALALRRQAAVPDRRPRRPCTTASAVINQALAAAAPRPTRRGAAATSPPTPRR